MRTGALHPEMSCNISGLPIIYEGGSYLSYKEDASLMVAQTDQF